MTLQPPRLLPHRCPECGEETITGYGLMFGNGLGTYVFCIDDRCSWYVKHHDAEDAPTPPDPPKQDVP